MEFYLEKKDKNIADIVKAAYPEYAGRTIRISTEIPAELDSYWTGGSRDYYVFYEMKTGTTIESKPNHPAYDKDNPRHLSKLPNEVILIMHKIFCGHDAGITIYVNQEDMTPLLPPPAEYSLEENEITVLKYTSTFLSSCRYEEASRDTGITRENWDEAKAKLAEKKLLTKKGAITFAGENYLISHNLNDLL